MNTQRWQRISMLLERAIVLDRAGRRALYALECADDRTVGDEVERLVAADGGAGRFLSVPPPTRPPARAVAVGARVGAYTLVRRIAAGGMGVVYEARQERPNRRVALKLLHPDAAGEHALRRFRYEAEALGRLRHTGIAQVYEAGVDVGPDGEERPFLAMELVDGARPFTTHARDARLDDGAIARLFLEVCAAVQHGHDRGVLHRDLKPSNVLVDAAGAVKIIDFGIAKVLGEQRTRATLAGEILGTLGAMSPEQLDGDASAIDVRTDVYALGALLHEALCGSPPLDLRGLSLTAALARARDGATAKPSSARPDLAPELEWIVTRALEPERERRYASVADLARDVERHLRNEPVHAGPPSTAYRAAKFVRRNGIAVGAAVLVVAAVLAGTVAALVQRDRAVLARARAETAEQIANERLGRIEAEARANRELADFQSGILKSADPDGAGRDARVVDALARASVELDERPELDPQLGLVLRSSIVDAYSALGSFAEVRREYARMRPMWESRYEPDAPERLMYERMALDLEVHLEGGDRHHATALDGLRRAEAATGADSDETNSWRITTARVEIQRGDNESGAARIAAAHAHFRARSGPVARETLIARDVMGRALCDSRRFDEAEEWIRATYEECAAAFGPDHGETLLAKKQYAVALGQLGRVEDSARVFGEVVDALARKNGRESARALTARTDRVEMLRQCGRHAEALEAIDSVFTDLAATGNARSRVQYTAHVRRARVLQDLDRTEEGVAELESALEQCERAWSPNDPLVVEIRSALVQLLLSLGRNAEAVVHGEHALRAARTAFGADSPETLVEANGLATALQYARREREAIPLLEAVLEAQDRRLGRFHRDSLVTLTNLSTAHLNTDRIDDAACTAWDLVARVESDPRSSLAALASARWALGRVQREHGDHHGAAASFAIASSAWERGGLACSTAAIHGLLDQAFTLDALKQRAAGLAVREDAAARVIRSTQPPQVRARALSSLAWCILHNGQPERAREIARMVLATPGPIEPSVRAMTERIAGQE